ncbi:MAG: peptide ABC transporter permease [Bacillota bacterium]|mgnify:FL=1|nr:MAG: peptide ABC transporter permease [Bacillota bacterium]
MHVATATPTTPVDGRAARRRAWARTREQLADFWRRFSKNRLAVVGGVVLLLVIIMGLFAPWIAPHDPTLPNFRNRFAPPAWMEGGSWEHPLGTDQLGRDMLSRIIWGARASLKVGAVVISFATVVGIFMGLVSGYYGGWVDVVIQRLSDILLAFPYLVLAIALMGVMGPGFGNLILALVYKEWVTPSRIVRGEVLAAKNVEYVEAARAVGARDRHIMWREILPNTFSSVIVVATLRVAWVILMEASLSFLGLGVQPPEPAWGSMIAQGREYIFSSWWLATFPGIAILLTVLGINLLGEGLRDALDPRLRE